MTTFHDDLENVDMTHFVTFCTKFAKVCKSFVNFENILEKTAADSSPKNALFSSFCTFTFVPVKT